MPPYRTRDLRNGSQAIAAFMRAAGRTSLWIWDQEVPSHSHRSSKNALLSSTPPNT